jgi:hypothetical protein
MRKHKNSFSRRRMLGMTAGSVLRRRLLAGIAVVLMGASLVFSGSTSAHDIDVKQARQKAEAYAQSVVKEGNRGYVSYTIIKCSALHRGHNHQVSCYIGYQNDRDSTDREWTCREFITIYMQAHRGDRRNWEYYMTHPEPEFKCGRRKLTGPNP